MSVHRPCAAVVAALLVAMLCFGGSASARCHTTACEQRVKARVLERHYQAVWVALPTAGREHLRRIAWCESRGDERAISPSGQYRGLLQFDYTTWQGMGGKGDPAAATRWEQWARGAMLYRARGPQPWPVCGFR